MFTLLDSVPPLPENPWLLWWGELGPDSYPWFQAFARTHREPDRTRSTLEIDIRVLPHEEVVFCYRQTLTEARVFRGSAILSDIGLSPASAGGVLKDAFYNLVLDLRGFLYEYDPRLGHAWGPGRPLPKCPLFDAEGMQKTPTSCFFCHKSLLTTDPPMWGGANVGWVHPACWGRGLPRVR
jgi:hypothetical protein